MAKRKKSTGKRKATRRRRVSGSANMQPLLLLGGAALGMIGANMLSNSLLPKVSQTWKGVGQAAVGVGGVLYMKQPFLIGLAVGIGANGVNDLGKGMGILSGRRLSMRQNYLNGPSGIQTQVNGPSGIQTQINGPSGIQSQVNGRTRAMAIAGA